MLFPSGSFWVRERKEIKQDYCLYIPQGFMYVLSVPKLYKRWIVTYNIRTKEKRNVYCGVRWLKEQGYTKTTPEYWVLMELGVTTFESRKEFFNRIST